MTTIGELRIAKLATAIVRGGGVATFPTAMAMLGESKQATSRTLDWLTKAGMLRKLPIPGGKHVWMSERALVRTFDPTETPAVYRLSRGTDRWVPGPTFDHDQLALRVLFSIAQPEDLFTEHEIRISDCWRGRIPDGVIRMMLPRRAEPAVVELEIETSKKTGAAFRPNGTMGGWAKLAHRLYRVAHDWAGYRQETELGFSEATLVVASRDHLKSIARKVREIRFAEEHSGIGRVVLEPTIWYCAEIGIDGNIGPVFGIATGGPAPDDRSPAASAPVNVETDIWV